MILRSGVLGICACACIASVADARPASTGFFAEGGAGVVDFLPSASNDASIGPAFDIRVGRDLFSWLSLGGYIAASSHEATVPPPPSGQWFQLYRGGADARLGALFDRVAAFVEGGVGESMISSNVLEKVMITKPGKSFSFTIHGGAGFEYQLENRHYAVGLAVDAFIEPQFKSMKALETRLYLRYTYGGG
ncbi:MAG TPA: hypothetical protein VLX92_13100 [Kofleriaceae bacterium]|nr:hypothetical protein [Kofleriaceae bacterium]